METSIVVRPAREGDEPTIVAIMRASIARLCFEDHRGDPAILGNWLANKTVENVKAWLANPDNRLLVAEHKGEPAAVGCVGIDGYIKLNYVAPSARFCGASSALLAAMEERAREAGVLECFLESTETAHRFYLRRGYVDQGARGEKFGIPNYSMRKSLIAV